MQAIGWVVVPSEAGRIWSVTVDPKYIYRRSDVVSML